LGRFLPFLLAPERSHIEVAPGAPERLVAAVVNEVGAEHAVAVADERVRAVPLVYAEVFVEVVRDGVPRHLPPHPRLHALDVRLRRARAEHQSGVAGVQMGKVTNVVSHHGAADAGMVGPAVHAGFEEGAVDDQLTAAVEAAPAEDTFQTLATRDSFCPMGARPMSTHPLVG